MRSTALNLGLFIGLMTGGESSDRRFTVTEADEAELFRLDNAMDVAQENRVRLSAVDTRTSDEADVKHQLWMKNYNQEAKEIYDQAKKKKEKAHEEWWKAFQDYEALKTDKWSVIAKGRTDYETSEAHEGRFYAADARTAKEYHEAWKSWVADKKEGTKADMMEAQKKYYRANHQWMKALDTVIDHE